MARNTRAKNGKEVLRPKAGVDDTTIDRATPQQLSEWLTSPPREDLLRVWRGQPWPLKRAVELERKDLFAAWVEHGCSPAGNLDGREDPIVRRLGSGTPRFIEWVAEYKPRSLVEVLNQLQGTQMASMYVREVNWGKILNSGKLSEDTLLSLATSAVIGGMEALPADKILGLTGGQIAHGWSLKNKLHSVGMCNVSILLGNLVGIDPEVDKKRAAHINNLPSGALLGADAGLVAAEGALLAGVALVEQITYNAGGELLDPPKRAICSDFKAMFKSWNNRGRGVAEKDLTEILDTIMPFIEWRKRDRVGLSALHAIHLPLWPQNVVDEFVGRIIQMRPSMIDQKNKKGETPEQSEDNAPQVRDFIKSYKRRAGMNNLLRHNVRQTRAVCEATRKEPEVAVVPARRPFM